MHNRDMPDTATTDRSARWRNLGLAVLIVAVLVFLFSYTTADPDLWGHIKFGQDFWETRQVVRADTYSYLSGSQPWINHEWLAEAVFAYVYDLANAPGLIVFKVLIALLIAGLAYGHLRRRELNPVRAWSLVLVASLLLFVGLGTIRPHMFTYLGFLLTLLLIYQADQGRERWLWGLPPMFALWVNLHGGVLAGVGILLLWALAYLVVALLKGRRPAVLLSAPVRTVVLATVASLLATLLNPYGVHLVLFLLRTATVPRLEIVEWQPVNILSVEGAIYLGMVLAAMAGLFYSKRRRSPTLLFLYGIMAFLPLVSVRHLPLFALAALVIAGEHMGDIWQQLSSSPQKGEGAHRRERLEAWLAGLFALASIVFAIASIDHFRCIRVNPSFYPYRAVTLLERSGASGNMAVHFNWGEFALWHLGPEIQVSMDGRRETVYDHEVYLENVAFMLGTGDWDALLTEHGTQLVLVGRDTTTHNLVELKPGWPILYQDAVSAIAVEEGSPLVEPIRAIKPPSVPQSDFFCFP